MKVGDLVRNIHTDEVGLVSSIEDGDYVNVDWAWLVPQEHLEVINESR
jgi:hypothetical protein